MGYQRGSVGNSVQSLGNGMILMGNYCSMIPPSQSLSASNPMSERPTRGSTVISRIHVDLFSFKMLIKLAHLVAHNSRRVFVSSPGPLK